MAKRTSFDLEDLPEALLIHILSFLPTLDAVRSSLISPKWRNLWHHVPILNFDIRAFYNPSNSLSESRDSFADLISQTLFLRPTNTPFHTFRLVFDFCSTGRRQIQVDSWARHAIDAGVTVLKLNFESHLVSRSRGEYGDCSDDDLPDDAFGLYDFHFSDLLRNNSSITVLKLVNCRVILPKLNGVALLGDGCFSSICSLTLAAVDLDDEELFVMVFSLVNLEYLSISRIHSLRDFKIYSEKLRELKMGIFMYGIGPAVGSFEISCPNLRKISFDSFTVEEYSAKELSSLVEARAQFLDKSEVDMACWWDLMKMLTWVERLATDNMGLDREDWVEFLGTTHFLKSSAFKNLNHLELRTGYTENDLVGIASFLEVCPGLESLVLDHYFEDDEKLSEDFRDKPFVLHIPSLKQVTMKNYRDTKNELFLVASLKKHNVMLNIAYPPVDNGETSPPRFL